MSIFRWELFPFAGLTERWNPYPYPEVFTVAPLLTSPAPTPNACAPLALFGFFDFAEPPPPLCAMLDWLLVAAGGGGGWL